MPQRPVNGTRSEYPMIAMERRVADLEQRTRQIPSRIRKNPSTENTGTTREITQTAHGFAVGQAIGAAPGSSTWQVVNGVSSTYEGDLVGVVVQASVNSFVVLIEGEYNIGSVLYIEGQPAGAGTAANNTLYYLKGSGTAGYVTATRPSTAPGLNRIRAVYLGLGNGRIYVMAPSLVRGHAHAIWDIAGMFLADPTVTSPAEGDVLTFSTANVAWRASAPSPVADDSVTNAKLRDSAGLSVIGRSANSTGDPADIVASANGHILRRKANALGFAAIEADDLAASPVAGKILIATSATALGWFAMSGGATMDAAGVVTLVYAAQAPNTVFAGPASGAAAAPTYRALAALDLGATPATAKMLLCSSASAHDWFAMSGDATIGATGALTLANSGATAATTGSASVVPVITVDVKGRVTAVTTATITPAAIGAVDTATFAAHTHSTGGDISGNLATISVDKIKGKAVPSAPADKTFLRYKNSTTEWEAYVLPLTARGALVTHDGTDLAMRAIGANGTFLKSNGTDNGWALPVIDDCDDVLITAAADADLLQYDGATSDWVNRTVDTVATGSSKLLPMGGFGTQTSRTTTGTHNFTAGKKFVMVILRAGGGGGAGGSSVLGSGSYAGGGGGEGEKRIIIVPIGAATTASVTIGAAGAGGATDASGTAGGDTSITINGTTYTAKGGVGAVGQSAGAGGASTSEPGNSNGLNITISGQPGQPGRIPLINYNGSGNITSYTNAAGAGGGGAAPRGTGGAGGVASNAGSPGIAGSAEIYER